MTIIDIPNNISSGQVRVKSFAESENHPLTTIIPAENGENSHSHDASCNMSMDFNNDHQITDIPIISEIEKPFRWRVRLGIYSNGTSVNIETPIFCRLTLENNLTNQQLINRILMHCKVHKPDIHFNNFYIINEGVRVQITDLDAKKLRNIDLIHALP